MATFALLSLINLSKSIHQEPKTYSTRPTNRKEGLRQSLEEKLPAFQQNLGKLNSIVGEKPSYPKFLIALENERQLLLEKSKNSTTPVPATNKQWWNLAPTPLDQPVHFTQHRILPPPRVDDSSHVIVLVLSGQHNFIKRQAIRETWAGHHTNVFFVIGQSNCDEETKNGDIENINNYTQSEDEEENYHDELGARRRQLRRRLLQDEEFVSNHSSIPKQDEESSPGNRSSIVKQTDEDSSSGNHSSIPKQDDEPSFSNRSSIVKQTDEDSSSGNHSSIPKQDDEPSFSNHSSIVKQTDEDSSSGNHASIPKQNIPKQDDESFSSNHSSIPKQDEDSPCLQSDHDFLVQEQIKYQDLIQIPMKENYRLLPEKVVQAYHWAIQTLPNAQWLVKADDDMFVRVQSLNHYLKKYNSQIPMVIGQIVPHSAVNREGKWAEPDYEPSYYPYWPQGSAGHVISRAAAQYISENSDSLHRFQGEDVSIGIWMDDAIKQFGRDVTYIQAKRMITNDGTKQCGVHKYLMIGHDLTAEEVYDCHLKFGKQTFQENAWLDDPAEFGKLIKDDEGTLSWNGAVSSLWNSGGMSTSASTGSGYQGPWANSGSTPYRGSSFNTVAAGNPKATVEGYLTALNRKSKSPHTPTTKTTIQDNMGNTVAMFKQGSSAGYRFPATMNN